MNKVNYNGRVGPLSFSLANITPATVGILIVTTVVLSVALLVFSVYVIAINVLDLATNGPAFWPVVWIILAAMYLMSVVTPHRKG